MNTQIPNIEQSNTISSFMKKIKKVQTLQNPNGKLINSYRLKIVALKRELQATDYKAIKYAEGELSVEEYAETREQRKIWRAEINALEEEIKALQIKED